MMQLTTEMNKKIWIEKTRRDGSVERYSIDAVSSDTRAKIMADLFKVLLARRAKSPKSPAESVSNAKDALNALNELSNDDPIPKSNGRAPSVDSRTTGVQAKQNPALDEGGLGSEQIPQ